MRHVYHPQHVNLVSHVHHIHHIHISTVINEVIGLLILCLHRVIISYTVMSSVLISYPFKVYIHVLSGPRTSLHVFDHIHYKKIAT